MPIDKCVRMIATALAAVCLHQAPAFAQFGLNLPRDDFTWIWGDAGDAASRRARDISTSGTDAGFRCNLTGNLRLGSRFNSNDIRALENDIRSSLSFIQTAASAMNTLDLRRELDWAKLDCTKPQAKEEDAEQRQQRLDRSREKMIEQQRARREKQQRNAQD